jgi:hypothetical protein
MCPHCERLSAAAAAVAGIGACFGVAADGNTKIELKQHSTQSYQNS